MSKYLFNLTEDDLMLGELLISRETLDAMRQLAKEFNKEYVDLRAVEPIEGTFKRVDEPTAVVKK